MRNICILHGGKDTDTLTKINYINELNKLKNSKKYLLEHRFLEEYNDNPDFYKLDKDKFLKDITKFAPHYIIIHAGTIFYENILDYIALFKEFKDKNPSVHLILETFNDWTILSDKPQNKAYVDESYEDGIFEDTKQTRKIIADIYHHPEITNTIGIFNDLKSLEKSLKEIINSCMLLVDQLNINPYIGGSINRNELYKYEIGIANLLIHHKDILMDYGLYFPIHSYKNKIDIFDLCLARLYHYKMEQNTENNAEYEQNLKDIRHDLTRLKFQISSQQYVIFEKFTDIHRETEIASTEKKRILILFSIHDDDLIRKEYQYKHNSIYSGLDCKILCAIDFCKSENIHSPNKFYSQLRETVLSHIPEIFVIHAGAILQNFPDEFLQAIGTLHHEYPQIRIGIDNLNALKSNADYSSIFDQSADVKQVIDLLQIRAGE